MGKLEWGMKRLCQYCGSRFYDLGHDPIICPSCQKPHDVEAATRLKRNRMQTMDEVEGKAKTEGEILDADLEVELEADIDTDDDSVLEDTSDIDTGDDMSEVVGVNKSEDGEEA